MALRFRDRVPVHRLFLKIFCWFWLTALVIMGIGLLARQVTDLRTIKSTNVYASVAPVLAEESAHVFEAEGPEAFARFASKLADGRDSQLYLLDEFKNDVLSRPISKEILRVANAARDDHLIATDHSLHVRTAAFKFVSSSGHPYTVVIYERSNLPDLSELIFDKAVPFLLSLLVVITALCFLLAYSIASPIWGIQSAARRVAQGDFSARAPEAVSKRGDELGALAIDFDSMVERIELLIRTQRSLLNSVSHELRSPLSRLNLSLAVLRKDEFAHSASTIERMERDIARIDTLIGQLLTLSRFEASLTSGTTEDVDFTLLVQEVAADGNFEAQALGKSVVLEEANSVVLQNADSLALRSACENIIRNAIHFTRPGTDVKVALEINAAAAAPEVLFTVRDMGPGVPEDSLENIFRPFFRVDQPGMRSQGNGLGLAIALEAVRMHQGSIEATNLSPQGLEVTVRLPASRPTR
ncbi:MAG TPA: ATP-binding protein [Chthoniobacterales bacterium]|nr:ATP-binding protein [Chthoniobacterales bacterium]